MRRKLPHLFMVHTRVNPEVQEKAYISRHHIVLLISLHHGNRNTGRREDRVCDMAQRFIHILYRPDCPACLHHSVLLPGREGCMPGGSLYINIIPGYSTVGNRHLQPGGLSYDGIIASLMGL